jgi:outer membrane protein assembly factor BamB
VVGAHGAFWVGGATGLLARVDAKTGALRPLRLPGSTQPIVAIGVSAAGVLVTTMAGDLFALDAQGTLLWKADGLGDVSGPPAEAAGVVGVLDRRGRILFFEASTGAPKGATDLGSEARGGVLSAGAFLVVGLVDGRLWIYDPALGVPIVDADLKGQGRFPPALVAPGLLAMPAKGASLSLLPIPGSVTR